jgi:hypothetical protein
MNVLTLVVFAAKVLCLMAFVSVLRPDGRTGTIQAPVKPVECGTSHAGVQKCSLNVATSLADAAHVLHVRVSLTAEKQSAGAQSQ